MSRAAFLPPGFERDHDADTEQPTLPALGRLTPPHLVVPTFASALSSSVW